MALNPNPVPYLNYHIKSQYGGTTIVPPSIHPPAVESDYTAAAGHHRLLLLSQKLLYLAHLQQYL